MEAQGEACGAAVTGINGSGDDGEEVPGDKMGESVAEGEPEMDKVGPDLEGGTGL